MSFLRVFQSVLHAIEAAAAIAAPIVKAVDPTIGALMTQAAQTAVTVEQAVTASGEQKAAIVSQATQAGIDLTNSLLQSQGKASLPAGIITAINATTKNVVDTLNTVADTVMPPAPAAQTPAAKPAQAQAATLEAPTPKTN